MILLNLSQRHLLLVAAAILLAPVACDSHDSSLVTARLSLEIPDTGLDQTAGDLFDEHGFFDLTRYPVFVAVSVSAPDMETQMTVWPQSADDLTPGLQTVVLLLDLTPGDDRQVDARVYLRDSKESFLFAPETAWTVALSPGSTKDIELNVSQLDDGTVSGTAPATATEVWLVDSQMGVLVDRVPVDEGTYAFARVPYDIAFEIWWLDDADEATLGETDVLLSAEDGEQNLDLTDGLEQ